MGMGQNLEPDQSTMWRTTKTMVNLGVAPVAEKWPVSGLERRRSWRKESDKTDRRPIETDGCLSSQVVLLFQRINAIACLDPLLCCCSFY